jgi:hypothetical protein
MVLIKHTIAILRNFISKAFLKRQSAGYKPKKARVFTRDKLAAFLLNAPDEK